MNAYSAPNNNSHALATTKHESEDRVPVQPSSPIDAGKDNQLQPNNPTEAEKSSQLQLSSPIGTEKNSRQQLQDCASASTADESSTYDDPFVTLLNITADNLEVVKKVFLATKKADKEVNTEVARFIVEEEYIDTLVSIFTDCEKAGEMSCLRTLRFILLETIDLCDSNVMDEILKDSNFLGCLGILASDSNGEVQYRQMLSRLDKFKEAIPIDLHTMELIRQVFRLQFLKDQLLSRLMSGKWEELFTGMIKAKSLELVQDISYDRRFMMELFTVMRAETEPMRRRNDVVLFVRQLCTMAQTTHLDVYKTLYSLGLFTLLEFAFASNDTRVKQAGIEILQMALEINMSLLRFHIVRRAQYNFPTGFLDVLVKQVLIEKDVDLIPQFAKAIRFLLNVNHETSEKSNSGSSHGGPSAAGQLDTHDPSAASFLDLFYTQYLATLIKPVLQPIRTSTSKDPSTSARWEEICNTMMILVGCHPLRFKTSIISCHLFKRFGHLLKTDDKKIRLIALKFFKACLDIKNEFYDRLLIANDVIHSLINLLQETNGNRDIINSACLEFFDHIRKNNIKLLVSHCVTLHKNALEGFTYIPIFKHLLALEPSNAGARAAGSSPSSILKPQGKKTLLQNSRSLFMVKQLFGDDKDHKVATGSNVLKPNLLRRKLDDTEFEENNTEGIIDGSVSSEKRVKLDPEAEAEDKKPSVGDALDAEQSGVDKETKTKRSRDDEDDAEPQEAAARAEPRMKLDTSYTSESH